MNNENVIHFEDDISFELKPESGDTVVWPDKDKTLLGRLIFQPILEMTAVIALVYLINLITNSLHVGLLS